MTELALSIRGLRKEFGSNVAVADLTLDVQRGEVFGFLGPNGAGKTTSIKMLLGLITPTAGQGTILGRPLGDRQTRARIGYLPEHFRFYEWLKASEFLNLHGRLFGMPQAERQRVIPDLLELVGLGRRSETRLSDFSKGMLQRIGLAQALMNNPDLVILDEPTSGLDPIGRRMVREIIDSLRREGTAVFVNSHLLSEIEKSCDRVAFIREGTVLAIHHLSEFDQEAFAVTLRVGQPTPTLLEQLAAFGQGVELSQANGQIQLMVNNEESLPRLAQWLIAEGHTLYELSPHRQTLEERFLKVVGDESGDS